METNKKRDFLKGKMSRTGFFLSSLFNRLGISFATVFFVSEGYIAVSIALLIVSTALQFLFDLKRMRDASSKTVVNYIISLLAVSPVILAIFSPEQIDTFNAVYFIIHVIILCLPPQKQKIVAATSE